MNCTVLNLRLKFGFYRFTEAERGVELFKENTYIYLYYNIYFVHSQTPPCACNIHLHMTQTYTTLSPLWVTGIKTILSGIVSRKIHVCKKKIAL